MVDSDASSKPPARLTVPAFTALKARGHKISMLTAYDYTLAKILDAAGVDSILVGDTLGMVVQGHDSTLPVTLNQMVYHAEMVGRAVQRALVVVDLPFPYCNVGPAKALQAASRILKKARCQAVKLEGGTNQAETVATLVRAGIPVMGHCGLRPQTVNLLGGYKVQRDAETLLADAKAIEQAGAFALILECIPSPLAQQVTQAVSIPTIGIGAGPLCDGQVLVTPDLLGLTTGYVPRFVKQYAQLGQVIQEAVGNYRREVSQQQFPGKEHGYS